jgi:hypothetical protein
MPSLMYWPTERAHDRARRGVDAQGQREWLDRGVLQPGTVNRRGRWLGVPQPALLFQHTGADDPDAGNLAEGLPEHAPLDRIIATCAVPEVPWAWMEQTRPGGIIIADVKIALGAGSLVHLTRYPDRAEGCFDPTYAAFMGLRHHPEPAHPVGIPADDHETYQVIEGGPRQVWRIIEEAHALWTTLDQPAWERFGLTVTENHQQVWLDTPASAHTWPAKCPTG